MDSTNSKVAEALGWEVREQEDESGNPELAAYAKDGKYYAPWRPAADPADALAALEAWCKAKGWSAALGCFGDQWSVCLPAHAIGVNGEFCEAVCKAILEAANG